VLEIAEFLERVAACPMPHNPTVQAGAARRRSRDRRSFRTAEFEEPGDQEMPEEDEKDTGFTVKDRRRFDAEGDTRDVEEGAAASPGEPETPPAQEAPPAAADENTVAEEPAEDGAGELGQLTFSGFVIGLAQQAFMFLGVIPDPQSAVVHKDLMQARAMIDIIEMLRDKTRGNLEEVEERMMEEMLEELHLQYVREVRASMHPQGDNQ
jgi:hypothetical protein